MMLQNDGVVIGSCHCGAVKWRFEGEPETATACNCTVCRRYGALWAYDWDGERIKTTGATVVYIRGDRELGFHHCDRCGCICWWRGLAPHPDGRTRIAVNLRLADDPAAVAQLPVRHFDGLDLWADLPDDGRCIGDMWF